MRADRKTTGPRAAAAALLWLVLGTGWSAPGAGPDTADGGGVTVADEEADQTADGAADGTADEGADGPAEAAARAGGGAAGSDGDTDGVATAATAAAPSARQATAAMRDAVSVADIQACLRANLPDRLRLRTFRIERTDARGSVRVTRGRMYMKRDEGRAQLNVQLRSPPEAAGTSYLWRELDSRDETLVYLPALERVRRVVGSGNEARLLDSDFSLRDIQQVQGAFAGGRSELLGQGEIAGRATWRLRSLPAEAPAETPAETPAAAEEAPLYRHVDSDIDQITCVTLGADFHDDKGLAKRYRADPDSLTEADGFAYARRLTMEDVRAGSRSVADIEDVDAPEELPRRLFSPSGFYLGN